MQELKRIEDIHEMMSVKWHLVETIEKHIGVEGYPEIFYVCYISDKPNGKGHIIAHPERWFGNNKQMEGVVEKHVMSHLIELHNQSLVNAKQDIVNAKETVVNAKQEVVEEPVKKKRGAPKGRPVWPIHIPQLRHPDGSRMKMKEVLAKLENDKKAQEPKVEEVQTPGVGALPSEQPVQTENPEAQKEVQSQDQTQEPTLGPGPSVWPV